jgi:hypothetical protein
MIRLGIDPGVTTGFAAWCDETHRLLDVCSLNIIEAMARAQIMYRAGILHSVTMEDARLRTWFGTKGREALQGAGSIKRDCQIWLEWAGFHGIALRSIKPAAGATKWDAEHFRRVTGWQGRTNEHARDAALLVFQSTGGRNAK